LGHPRLFFTAQELARLRETAKDATTGALGVSPKSMFDPILQRARKYQAEPFKRTADEYVLRVLQSRLDDLTLAYAITGDLDLQIALLRDLTEICTMRSWGDMSGVFGMLSVGAGVAFAYDVLYPMLNEEEGVDLETYLKRHGLYRAYAKLHKKEDTTFEAPEQEEEDELEGVGMPNDLLEKAKPPAWKVQGRKVLREALVRSVAAPLYASAKRGQFVGLSNGYIYQLSSLGMIALTLLGEEDCPDAPKWLDAAENGLRRILDLSDPDGGWIEGIGYGSMAFDKLIIFADALKRVTRRDLMSHPALGNNPFFALYTASPDANYGLGFCDTWGHPGFSLSAMRLSQDSRDPHVLWHLKRLGYPSPGAEGIHQFLFHHPGVPPSSPDGALPKGRHFRGIGWVTFRASWDDPDALFFALKSGPDGYHTQNDQNHFELYAWRSYLSTDHGYTHRRAWRGGTVGHNSLLIDGQGQCCGWVRNRSGKVLEFLSAPAFGYVRANANSYGTREPLLDSFHRQVHFTPPNHVVIYDDVRSRKDIPRRATFLLQITREHSRPQKGDVELGGNEAYLVPIGSRAWLRSVFVHPEGTKLRRRMYYDRRYDELTGPYLAADAPGKSARNRFLVVLYPERVSDGEAARENVKIAKVEADGGVGTLVRSSQGSDVHLFRSGDTPVSCQDFSFVGASALLSRTPDGRVSRFALCEGTSLRKGARVLAESTEPASMAFSNWRHYDVQGDTRIPQFEKSRLFGSIALRADSHVAFWSPRKPVRLAVGGKEAQFRYDEKAGLCRLDLAAGSYSVQARLGE